MRCLENIRVFRATGLWLLAALLFWGTAISQEPELVVRPDEQALVLTELVESEPTTVKGVFKARLVDWPENVAKVRLKLELHDEMLRAEGREARRILNITDVSFDPSQPELTKGKTTTITVTVENVEWPGLYKGMIVVTPETQEKKEEGEEEEEPFVEKPELVKKLELELDIRTKPRIFSPQSEIELGLVRCWWIGCKIAGWFLAENPKPGPLLIELRNDSLSSVKIRSHAHIREETSGELVALLEPPEQQRIEIGDDPKSFDFKVKPAALEPGSYEGKLIFTASRPLEPVLQGRGPEGAARVRNRTRVEVPIEVHVRAGVGFLLVMIFLGILAGRLNREISTPEARERLKLYDSTVDLRDRIDRLTDPTAKQELRQRLATIRRRIEDDSIPLEELRKDLDELAERIRVLEGHEESEAELQRQEELNAETDAITAIRSEISSARHSAAHGSDLTLEKQRLLRIRAAILELSAGGGKQQVEALLPQDPTVEALRTVSAETQEAPAGELHRFLVKSLAILAGLRRLDVRASYWYIQPVATLFLLGALTVYGVFLFYTGQENRAFGAHGIVDYVPAFLWGFGSDVLTKRLEDIRFTRP